MNLSGRPLFDNPLDNALYVRRPEDQRLEANCRDGINTLMFGERGAGKTSLMRNVLFRLREEGFPAVGIDAAPADDALDLLRMIAAAVGPLSIRPGSINPMSVVGLGETGAILDQLRALRSSARSEGPKTAILIDLPAGAKVHQLFGRFRDELWQLPFTWAVSAPKELRVELLTPPANAFFEDVVELGPLTLQQQQELIQRRLEPGEMTPWRLSNEGEGNPRRLLEIVRESAREGQPLARRFQAIESRDLEVAELGESAALLYEDLENYGPASASDEELLGRLGWSRQRAAQVFAALEAAGYVKGERKAGPAGRPRKVFTILPPESR